MTETFSGFTDSNLFSKKQWIFPDKFVFYMGFIIPFVLIIVFYDSFRSIVSITKYKFSIILILIIYLFSHFISDLITAIAHCCFIDNSFSDEIYKIKDDRIIVNTTTGYASCHHIFPSNWKDISDSTLLISVTTLAFIPFLLIFYFIKKPLIKLFCYFTILLLMFAVFTHKYAHEKLHKRYVPWAMDFLLEHGLFLSPKTHQKHHIENNYNWALLNGVSDNFYNYLIKNICNIFKKKPMEDTQNNALLYLKNKQFNDGIIKIQFVGDVEGTFRCKLDKNLFVKVT